ncbi:MAG: ferritin-like domain-containing protein [Pseudomonadota bacterium]
MSESLFEQALGALLTADPAQKCARTQALWAQWTAGALSLVGGGEVVPLPAPGRPARPPLVPPKDLPKRNRLHTPAGRAVLLHALAHIEFNAVNLALDAVYRFRELPRDYYHDWLNVAREEARHFELLRDHIRGLEADYGDFPAHDGLWQMAVDTAHDPLVRMALVPRVLEARGLDVTPGLIERLEAAGDPQAAAILRLIRRDEIGHVAVGTRWFHYLCAQRGLEPVGTFFALVEQYMKGRLKGPFNLEDRVQAGFLAAELEQLRNLG